MYSPDPLYTAEAEKAHVKGTVVLSVNISGDGCVHDVTVSKKLGYGLDESAAYAVSLWKFRPLNDERGKPRPIHIMVEINFDPVTSSQTAPKPGPCQAGKTAKPTTDSRRRF